MQNYFKYFNENVNFFKEKFRVSDINFEDTYFKQRGRQITNPNTDVDYIKFKDNLWNIINNRYNFDYYFTYDQTLYDQTPERELIKNNLGRS